MNRLSFAFLSVLLAALIGCATMPEPAVNNQYDPAMDYARFKTYAWLPIPEQVRVNPSVVQRVQEIADGLLLSKGLVQTSENPDLLIALHAERQEKLDTSFWGYEVRKRQRRWGGQAEEFTYEEGMLVLDFLDAGTKEVFWRGWARGIIDPGASPETRDRRLNEVVTKMLVAFPPPR